MKRKIKKQFMLSEDEDAVLKDKVRRTCLSEAAFLRLIIKGSVPKEKPDKEFYQAMNQISAIGNNINQIARNANSLGFVDVPTLEREVEALQAFRLAIEKKYLLPEKDESWQ